MVDTSADYLITKHSFLLTSVFCVSLFSGACRRDGAKTEKRTSAPTASATVQPPPPPASPEADEIAAGTPVEVEISDTLDSDAAVPGYFIHARVTSDVKAPNGKVAIPANSSGVIAVLGSSNRDGRSTLSIALYQLTVGGHSYTLTNGAKQLAVLNFTEMAAQGPGHRSVHLQGGSRLRFVPSEKLRFAAQTER